MNTENITDLIEKASQLCDAGNLTEALAVYSSVLSQDADHHEACLMAGSIYGETGQLDKAARLLKKASELKPDDTASYLTLAHVLRALGDRTQAINTLESAVRTCPESVEVHYMLGGMQYEAGQLAEAVNSLRQAVRIKPDLAAAHLDMGNALYSLGRPDEAEHSLQQALRLAPSADTYFFLGEIQFSQGQMPEARASYQQALQLNPARADICNALGFACLCLGRLNEAAESCRQAIKLQPDFAHAYSNLGKALIRLGRIDEAVTCLQEALRLKPGFIQAAACIVAAYEMAGDYRKAGDYLAPLIEKHPDDPAVALSFARLCKHIDRCHEAADMMEKVLQQSNLPPLDRKELHFLAGMNYDSMNAFDTAFTHFQSANSILATPYDPTKHALDIDALISTFSMDLMHSLPRASHVSERPVFILGMPRSGTSLVEQVLASHPQVFGAGELADIGAIAAKAMSLPDIRNNFTEEAANAFARDYLDRIDALSPDAIRITDKMPHNFLHLGIINLIFPNARIIHCIRNPIDTCLSIYFQYFSASHPYASSLEHIATHYREYERLMAHWRQILDIPMLEVHYEELVTCPDEMIPKLVEFCGLEWDPTCLRFYENRRTVITASYDQVRQPLHPKSIGRWKHYENHLGALQSALGN